MTTPDTIRCRCIECGALLDLPRDDVPPEEHDLPLPETCCDPCLIRLFEEVFGPLPAIVPSEKERSL